MCGEQDWQRLRQQKEGSRLEVGVHLSVTITSLNLWAKRSLGGFPSIAGGAWQELEVLLGALALSQIDRASLLVTRLSSIRC